MASYPLTDQQIAELARMRRKLDGLKVLGMPFRNDSDGITIGPPPAPTPASVPQPTGADTGQYQYQSKMMVSQNQAGWDFIMAHPLL